MRNGLFLILKFAFLTVAGSISVSAGAVDLTRPAHKEAVPLRDLVDVNTFHISPVYLKGSNSIIYLQQDLNGSSLVQAHNGIGLNKRIAELPADIMANFPIVPSDERSIYVEGTVSGAGPSIVKAADVRGEEITPLLPPAPFGRGLMSYSNFATSRNNYGFFRFIYRIPETGQLAVWSSESGGIKTIESGVGVIPISNAGTGLSGITVQYVGGSQRWLGVRDGKGVPLFTFSEESVRRGADVVGLDNSQEYLYYLSDNGVDTTSLWKINLKTLKSALVAEESGDITSVSVNPTTGEPDMVFSEFGAPKAHALSEEAKKAIATIKEKLSSGNYPLVRYRSIDDRYWIVQAVSANRGVVWRVFDRTASEFVASVTPDPDDGNPSSKTEIYDIKVRDGSDVISYVSKDSTKCPQSCPTLFDIHGGPGERSTYEYNKYRAWLVSLGYQVVELNYRGSSGRGKRFEHSDVGAWGTEIQTDVEDVYDYLATAGVIQKPVGIMGSSFGAYVALNAVGRSSRFSLAVVDSPITDLEKFVRFHIQQSDGATDLLKRVGDPSVETERESFRERSPVSFVNDLRSPILVLQGAQDEVTPLVANEAFYKALIRADPNSSVVIFPHGQHGLGSSGAVKNALTERFLSEHLGGSFTPYNTFELDRMDQLQFTGRKMPVPNDELVGGGLHE